MARPVGMNKVLLLLQTVFDGLIYLAVVASVFLIRVLVDPYRRGILCNDVTISYKKLPDSVSNRQLFFCGICIPIALIVLLELYSKFIQGIQCSGRIKQFLISSLKLIAMFLYGAALTLLVTMSLKTMIGRLRPHFMDTCRPDLELYNCTSSERYIPDVSCADEVTDAEESDARAAFPSGHASLAVYSATFLVIYIEDRLLITFSVLLKSVVQVVVVILALYACVSRVSDNRHHVSDVVAGGFLGIVVALYTVVCVSHHFRHESSLAPSGGGEVVSMIDLGQETAYRRQKSVGAESTATSATAKSSHSDVLLPV